MIKKKVIMKVIAIGTYQKDQIDKTVMFMNMIGINMIMENHL